MGFGGQLARREKQSMTDYQGNFVIDLQCFFNL